jgi:hypothetical protein
MNFLFPTPPLITPQAYPRKAGANVILLFYSHNNFLKKISNVFSIYINAVWKRTISDLGRQMYYNNVT